MRSSKAAVGARAQAEGLALFIACTLRLEQVVSDRSQIDKAPVTHKRPGGGCLLLGWRVLGRARLASRSPGRSCVRLLGLGPESVCESRNHFPSSHIRRAPPQERGSAVLACCCLPRTITPSKCKKAQQERACTQPKCRAAVVAVATPRSLSLRQVPGFCCAPPAPPIRASEC